MLYKLVRLVIHITYLQSDNYVTFMTVVVVVAVAVANQSEDLPRSVLLIVVLDTENASFFLYS